MWQLVLMSIAMQRDVGTSNAKHAFQMNNQAGHNMGVACEPDNKVRCSKLYSTVTLPISYSINQPCPPPPPPYPHQVNHTLS